MKLKPYPEYKDSGVPWLGRVPGHWTTAAVKRHYAIQLGKMLQGQPSGPDDREVLYLKAQHVQWFAVRTANAPKMWASSRDVRQFGIVTGDLLVCEGGEGGRCGIVKDIAEPYIIQNALHRVRPIDQCRNDFLQYVMSAVATTGWFDAINNKATIAHFTREKFGSLGLPIPSPNEQSAIVRYLDHIDRRIQQYIRAKRRLIALLNEQKQAIIHRAVTRGLDPNVRLKSSGVDWLGEVPEHWEVVPLRRVISFVTSGSRGWANFYSETGDIFLQSGNLGRSMALNLSVIQYVQPPQGSEGERTEVRRDDVLVCITGALTGNVALVDVDLPARAFVNQHIALVRPSQAMIYPQYLAFALHSEVGRIQFKTSEYGGTKQGLGLEDVKSALVPLPPLSEQIAICSELNVRVAGLATAISNAHREISFLREYGTRLIADVVTGKLDVRGVELPELDEIESLVELDGERMMEVTDLDTDSDDEDMAEEVEQV